MTEDIKTVYAAVLNYNNYKDTFDCIKHLLASTYKNVKVVVVDNNSANNSLKELHQLLVTEHPSVSVSVFSDKDYFVFDKKITLIQSGVNNGFAAGYNLMFNAFKTLNAYVFMVNPDVNVTPETIDLLVNFYAALKQKAIVGCSMYDHATGRYLYSGGIKISALTGTVNLIKNTAETSLDYVCGGAMFFAAEALTDIGLFPEDYFLYWEDADWSLKAKQKGYRLFLCDKAKVYDKGATSIGRGFVAEYYYTRNSLIFHKKNKQPVFTIIMSNIFFRFPKKIILGQFNRAKAVIEGTADFLSKQYVHAAKKNINTN